MDGNRGGIVGETRVEIGQDVHTEIQWGLWSAWAGSDGTPTFRVDQMPYGGVKASGNTKEGPPHTVREMTEERLVVLANAG